MVEQARDMLPVGGTIVVETNAFAARMSGGRPRQVQLIVSASGDAVQRPRETAKLEALAAECQGELILSGDFATSSSMEVTFKAGNN